MGGLRHDWVIELLPFLEEQPLNDELEARPALVGSDVSPLARKRPALFTCPNGFDGDSSLAEIPAAHYLLEPPAQREVGKIIKTTAVANIGDTNRRFE